MKHWRHVFLIYVWWRAYTHKIYNVDLDKRGARRHERCRDNCQQDAMSGAGTTASDGVPTSEVVDVDPWSASEQSHPVENRAFDPLNPVP